MSRKTTLYLIFLFVIAQWAASTPVPEALPLRSRQVMGGDNPPPNLEAGNCQTERSDDYYGLGVRLGIYLAWVQAWIAFNFVPSEIAGTLDTNTIFLLAVVLAMIRCTITDLIVQVDGLILMHLGAGTVFGVLSIWGYRTSWYLRDGPTKGITHFGGIGTHARLLLCVAFAAYGLYFWMKGVHGPNPGLSPGSPDDTDPACLTLYTFMFAKLRADGGIRLFYIIICICCLVYWGAMLLASSLTVIARVAKIYKLTQYRQWRTTSKLHFATGLSHKQLRYFFYFHSGYTLIWMIFSMVMVEFSLNYNMMWQVLGWRGRFWFPSQLIPTVIGICGLFRVLFVGFQQWRSNDEEPSLDKDEPLIVAGDAPKPNLRAFLGRIVARTVVSAREVYVHKYQHRDDEMDPLLEGQPARLRYLVSFLPWLALVRWWHLQDEDYERDLYEHPNLQIKPRARQESPSTNNLPRDRRHASWGSDATAAESPRSANIARKKSNTKSVS